MASILSIASDFSTRGNSVCDLPSEAPAASWPQRRPSSSTSRDAAGLAEQRPDFCGAFRQNGMRQRGDDAQALRRWSQRIVALRCCVGFGVAERPRLLGGQIFVGGGDDGPDEFERAGEIQAFRRCSRTSPIAVCVSRCQCFVLRLRASPALGIFPAKFFSIIAAVRLARLPRPLARSLL